MHLPLLSLMAILTTTATASSLINRDELKLDAGGNIPPEWTPYTPPHCDQGCCGLYHEDRRSGNGKHHIINDAKKCTPLAVDGEMPKSTDYHWIWTKLECNDCKFFE
jgi:hypothetical protein